MRSSIAMRSTTHCAPTRIASRSARRGTLTRSRAAVRSFFRQNSLNVDQPAFGGISARSLSLEMQAHGSLSHQQAAFSLALPGLAIDGLPITDNTANLSATFNRQPWSLRVEGDLDGYAHAEIAASASFDRDSHAVTFDIHGAASKLVPIAWLADFDLARLELGLAARGKLFGVVAGVGAKEGIALEPDPWRTAAIEGSANLHVAKLRWARRDRDIALAVPAFVWHGDMRANGALRTLHGHADVDSVRIALGSRGIDLAGLSDDARVTVVGDLRNPTNRRHGARDHPSRRTDYLVEYPISDLTVALSAGRSRDGLIRLASLDVRNARGGTTFGASGSVDPEGRRRRLALTGAVTQDLAALSVFFRIASRAGAECWSRQLSSTPISSFFRTQFDVRNRIELAYGSRPRTSKPTRSTGRSPFASRSTSIMAASPRAANSRPLHSASSGSRTVTRSFDAEASCRSGA